MRVAQQINNPGHVPTVCQERISMLLETETGKTVSLPLNKKDVDKMGFKEENVGWLRRAHGKG